VGEAFLVGVVVAVPLLAGAVIATIRPARPHVLATVLAFASGAMMAAVAFELVAEADRTASIGVVAAALLGGALAYLLVDALAEYRFASAAVGPALLIGVLLDGIPENVALGGSLSEQGGLALAAAIFVANLPEALGGAAEMLRQMSRRSVLAIWGAAAVVTGIMVPFGRFLLVDASGPWNGFVLAFAGGAVIAVLATTAMPEAFKEGGPWIALATAAGFMVAYVLSA
jgi:zinc transporter ZupT